MKTKHHSIPSAPVTQSGDQTRNHSVRRKWFTLALGGFLFTSVFALWPSSAHAGCAQWDVSGEWSITQGSYFIRVVLTQNGKTISGTAKQSWTADHQVKELNGQLTGTIAGGTFYAQINWSGGGAGVYSGEIAKDGRLWGTTYDKNHLGSTARWVSNRKNFNCADATAAPVRLGVEAKLSPTPKPILRSGKARPAPLPMNSYDANDPNRKGSGFISGLQLPTPTPSAEADESSSSDTEDQHGKHKKNKNKNKKKHHHQDDDQDQGND